MNISTNGHSDNGFSLNGNGSSLNGSAALISVPGVTSKYTPSSKRNPCPVCQREKDGDCRVGEFGNLALCHTFQDGRADETRNGYRFIRVSDKGAGWGVWGWGEKKGKKGYRPSVEPQTVYQYPDRDGNPLIRVTRQKGKQPEFYQSYFVEGAWLTASKVADTVKAEMRGRVPLYRYAEVRAAIERDEAIVFVEGEVCADALWKIGVPATTSIGGSKSYSTWGNYSADLAGARLVVGMPDRDQVGMKYLEAVMKDQPIQHWIKAFPKSPLWGITLPEDGGLDVADWIGEGATKGDVLALIRDLRKEVTEVGDVPGYVLVTGAGTGANAYVSTVGGVGDVGGADLEESLKELLQIERNKGERFPVVFSEKTERLIDRAARVMPTSTDAIKATFLAALGILIGRSAQISLGMGWVEPAVMWMMLVAESGTMKTPTQALISDVLFDIQFGYKKEWMFNKDDWEQKAKQAKQAKEQLDTPEPKMRQLIVSDTTIEALGQIHTDNPRGIGVYVDEMDAFYARHNQYKSGGKGDEEQKWLSLSSGGAIKVDRLSRSLFLRHTAVSMFGTIQPDTIATHLRNSKKNSSGMNARWNYCAPEMPLSLYDPKIDSAERDSAIADLKSHFKKLFANILSISPRLLDEETGECIPWTYGLSAETQHYFQSEWRNEIVLQQARETHSGMRAVLAKQRGYAGRNALAIHIEHYCSGLNDDQDANPPKTISKGVVQRGVAVAQYFIAQAYNLYGVAGLESEDKKETDWTPILLRLKEASISLEDENGNGWISPRAARHKTRLIKSSEHAKSVFAHLLEHQVGELDASGKSPRWRWIDPQPTEVNEAIGKGVHSATNVNTNSQSIGNKGFEDVTLDATIDEDGVHNQENSVNTPKENPFPEPKQPEPKEDPSIHYSDENIANLADLVRAAIEDGCPEEIDSLFEPTPIKIREQVRELVMMQIDPGQSVTVEQEEAIITEHDGFKIGDRVKLSLDRLTPENRKVRIKEGGIEHDGEEGEVIGFAEYKSYDLISIRIRLDNGTVEDFGAIYVSHSIKRDDSWVPVG